MGSKIMDGEFWALRMGFASAVTMRSVLAGQRGFRVRVGTDTVIARIDAGRWVADCPYCLGSEVVSKAFPVFFCQSCGMAAASGAVRVAVFPADVSGTEAGVEDLPIRQRFWVPS